jgi:heme exporter protein D
VLRKQSRISEFEASLVYIVCYRIARATQRNSVLKNRREKKRREEKRREEKRREEKRRIKFL